MLQGIAEDGGPQHFLLPLPLPLSPDEKVAIVALSLRNPSSHPSTEPRGAFSFQDVTSPNQSSAPYRAFNTRQMDSE